MDEFVSAYIEAALWSSTDTSGDDGDDTCLDANYGHQDIAAETLTAMRADCEKFIELTAGLIEAEQAEQAGHDFWLTRNGHGAGFWDGDWGEELGEKLTAICDEFGEVDLYAHAGQVHQSPISMICAPAQPSV